MPTDFTTLVKFMGTREDQPEQEQIGEAYALIKKDSEKMGLTREAQSASVNREEWRRRAAQCVHLPGAAK